MIYKSERKKEIWRQIKKIREEIKNDPLRSLNLRVKLNTLLDWHKEAVHAEKKENKRITSL